MGANIYPDDVEAVIYGDPALAPHVHSFCLSLGADAAGTPRPCVALELRQGASAGILDADRVAVTVRDSLAKVDLDFREAVTEFPSAMLPIVTLHEAGSGPFAADQGRIKQRRILPAVHSTSKEITP